jgi:hypothetical protein
MKYKTITLTLKVESIHAKMWVEKLLDFVSSLDTISQEDYGLQTVTSEVSEEE